MLTEIQLHDKNVIFFLHLNITKYNLMAYFINLSFVHLNSRQAKFEIIFYFKQQMHKPPQIRNVFYKSLNS